MNETFLIIRQGDKLDANGALYRLKTFESDAVAEAKCLAIKHNHPFEVYKIELIGSSCLPQSKYVDYRAVAAAPASAA